MLYRDIIAVYSQIHTKHRNTLCGRNVGFLNVKLAVRIVTTGLQRVKVPTPHGTLSVGRTIGVKNDKARLFSCEWRLSQG